MKARNIFYGTFIVLALFIISLGKADAQQAAVKTNFLYGATTSPNLAMEFQLGKRVTLEVGGGMSLWDFDAVHRFKHWMAQPELRLWTCDAFNGHFFGLHLHGGQYDISNMDLGLCYLKELKDYEYQGHFYGAGLSYGYQWILGRHWNLETSVGGGYARFVYDKSLCMICNAPIESGVYNYWGVTRATLSLVYVF